MQGDIRKVDGPDFMPASKDLIFSRLLNHGMTDWQGYVNQIAAMLKPGGYVEMQDFALEWLDTNGRPCDAEWEWAKLLRRNAASLDMDVFCGKHLEDYMRAAGLDVVEVQEYKTPIGDWMANEGRPESKRLGLVLQEGHSKLVPLLVEKTAKEMGLDNEKTQSLKEECLNTFSSEAIDKYMLFYVVVGKKPEASGLCVVM